jgi:hypothetical protein
MICYLVVVLSQIHVVFGSLAIMVTSVTVDPLALRPRISQGLPLSNGRMDIDSCWKKTASPEVIQARRIKFRSQIYDLQRPGNHSHMGDVRPVGFASSVFTEFAFFGCFLLVTLYTIFVLLLITIS